MHNVVLHCLQLKLTIRSTNPMHVSVPKYQQHPHKKQNFKKCSTLNGNFKPTSIFYETEHKLLSFILAVSGKAP